MRQNQTSIVRGDTWVRTWILKDPQTKTTIDITGARARLHLREPSGALAIACGTDLNNMFVDGALGRIDLRVEAEQTRALKPLDEGYSFDCEVTFSDGRVRTIEMGSLTVFLDSTHD